MKKIKLSLIEREILWTLEEAGFGNLTALEAVIKNNVRDFSSEYFSQSLDNLDKKEFIYFEKSNVEGNSVVLTERGKRCLSI